ncbi:MAG: hypothetical protein ACI9FJ_002357 [Alteromonadaceae bacterium]
MRIDLSISENSKNCQIIASVYSTLVIFAECIPKIMAGQYDPRNIRASQKSGLTIGMAMTEKQGGSDV